MKKCSAKLYLFNIQWECTLPEGHKGDVHCHEYVSDINPEAELTYSQAHGAFTWTLQTVIKEE